MSYVRPSALVNFDPQYFRARSPPVGKVFELEGITILCVTQ